MTFPVISLLKRLFVGLGALIRRPRQRQIAALVWRHSETGETEVLIITTRRSGRWSVPKGWPIEGMTSPEAAAQEAWEEAGVRGDIEREPLGAFTYEKSKSGDGPAMRMTADIFALRLSTFADEYPEAGQRKRAWRTPAEAAEIVQGPELKTILRSFKR
jgi:8-oxo-dGTP pyrophosphatase MutT (NUDIX family)